MTTKTKPAKSSTATAGALEQAVIRVLAPIIGGRCGSKYCQICGGKK